MANDNKLTPAELAVVARHQLSDRELAVLYLYSQFNGPKVAQLMGLTKQRVHRIYQGAMKKVNWQLAGHSVPELTETATARGVDKELW